MQVIGNRTVDNKIKVELIKYASRKMKRKIGKGEKGGKAFACEQRKESANGRRMKNGVDCDGIKKRERKKLYDRLSSHSYAFIIRYLILT